MAKVKSINHIAFAVKELAKRMSASTEGDWARPKHLGRYFKGWCVPALPKHGGGAVAAEQKELEGPSASEPKAGKGKAGNGKAAKAGKASKK